MSGGPLRDFRQGDADDNRASPQRGGLRSLLLSAALEFSYPKAAIGFLALIVGPALLIGAIPPLAITIARLKFRTAAAATYAPLVAAITLAALIGAVLWIGRPIASKAIEKFWQLHYSMVFPLFVTFREILRSIAEWFPGGTTREGLERRRWLGTVLGALLIAALGLWVATGVELATAFEVDGPWTLMKVVLRNAAVVFGLSTFIESLYWVWRELRYRGRVLDWSPATIHPASSTVRIAHLSDPHFVGERYGYRMETGTRGPRGDGCIDAALEKLAHIDRDARLDRILITGDITDAGTRAEWAEFADTIERYPALRPRLSFVPGNHDVNITDRYNPGRFDLPWSAGQSLRQFRTVVAMDLVQGDRAHLVDRPTGEIGPTLRDYLRAGNRAELLHALAERRAWRGRREMSRVWDAIFPLIEPPRDGVPYGVILLNSNARSHFSLTNAIGVVAPSQLKAMRSILRSFADTPWLILLHHQVVEYPQPNISLTDRIGLALVNAPDVLDAIMPHASRCVILHGHRHLDWIGCTSGIVLCSAPSVTFGASFFVHNFSTAERSVTLAATTRINIP